MDGTIERLTDKGFGFIKVKGSTAEYFFHGSALRNAKFNELKKGQSVTFEPGEGPKGPRAEEVFVE